MRIKTAIMIGFMLALASGAQAQLRKPYDHRPDFRDEIGDSSRDFDNDMNDRMQARKLQTRAAEFANQGRLTEACASIREAIHYRRNIVYRRLQRSSRVYHPSITEDRAIEELGKDEVRYCTAAG